MLTDPTRANQEIRFPRSRDLTADWGVWWGRGISRHISVMGEGEVEMRFVKGGGWGSGAVRGERGDSE